ncbi:MAG: hypothetical protein J6I98_08115, partial [Clostridia bacterium]|nr:hypothetical protein [Clostridia bacterium]
MKIKAVLLSVFIVLFSLLPAVSVSASETVLAEGISDTAEVLLFAPYGSTSVFAYNDTKTYILKANGSASCTTAYPASHVFLCGETVTSVSPMEDLTVVERLNAASLSRTDLIGVDLPADDILDLDADRFGRLYAVRNSEPDVLRIFGEDGSLAGTITCPVNILRIQVLDDTLYLFLPEQCLQIALGQNLPQAYTKSFSYTNAAVPFCMLNASVYVSTNGTVYTTAGAALTTTGHYALRETALASGSDALFWADDEGTVFRYSYSGANTAYC